MFSKVLKRLLSRFDININQFSRMTGFSTSTIYRWINDEASPTYENILKIAESLKFEVVDLFMTDRDLVILKSPHIQQIIKLIKGLEPEQLQRVGDFIKCTFLNVPVRE